MAAATHSSLHTENTTPAAAELHRQRRILILMSDAGSGHRSAAQALEQVFRDRYGYAAAVSVVNPIRHPQAAWLVQRYERLYRDLVTYLPAFYQVGYTLTNRPGVDDLLVSALDVLLMHSLRDIVRHTRPDAVISVFPLFTTLIARMLRSDATQPGLISVVTDLGRVHRAWFSYCDDYCAVPTAETREIACSFGLAPDSVVITGIPIQPTFSMPRGDQQSLKQRLGWQADLPVVLVLGGGAGVGQIGAVALALDAAQLPIQLAVVTGTNAELERVLRSQSWHIPVHVYGFVALADLMFAADVICTKAGGLTLSEALAAGKPLVLYGAPYGQEYTNLLAVCEAGAGCWAVEPENVVAQVRAWLEQPAKYAAATRAAGMLGRPAAAFTIAQLGWELACGAPYAVKPHSDSRHAHPAATHRMCWISSGT